MLEALEQTKLCEIVRMGCPREAAAKIVGLTPEELEAEVARDKALAKALLKAEGEAVFLYMRNVRNAASDEKNWRTSVWWLEHQLRLEGRLDGTPAGIPEAVLEALERFAELIVAEIPDVLRRQSLLMRLMNIAAESVGRRDQSKVIDVSPALLSSSPSLTPLSPSSERDDEGALP